MKKYLPLSLMLFAHASFFAMNSNGSSSPNNLTWNSDDHGFVIITAPEETESFKEQIASLKQELNEVTKSFHTERAVNVETTNKNFKIKNTMHQIQRNQNMLIGLGCVGTAATCLAWHCWYVNQYCYKTC